MSVREVESVGQNACTVPAAVLVRLRVLALRSHLKSIERSVRICSTCTVLVSIPGVFHSQLNGNPIQKEKHDARSIHTVD